MESGRTAAALRLCVKKQSRWLKLADLVETADCGGGDEYEYPLEV